VYRENGDLSGEESSSDFLDDKAMMIKLVG
jgi:hypothetical protein